MFPIGAERCALAVDDYRQDGTPIFRCSSRHPHRTPVIPGETFISKSVAGGVSVLLEVCPGYCRAFVKIVQGHDHMYDDSEQR